MNIFTFCACENETAFKNYLLPSCNELKLPCINIQDDPNSPIKCTREQKYNAAISNILQHPQLQDDDIVIIAKETVLLIDKEIKEKLSLLFSSNEFKDVALWGVCGVLSLNKSPFFINESFGQLMVPTPDDPNCGDVLEFQHVGCSTQLLTVYDNIFAIRVKVLKQNFLFDDKNFKNNPFYLLDLCIRLIKANYKICATNVLVYDASKLIFEDPDANCVFNCENYNSFENIFLEKHGLQFPITLQSLQSLQSEKVTISVDDL